MANLPYNTRTSRVEGSSIVASFFSAATEGVVELANGITSSYHFAGKTTLSAERIQRSVAVFDSRPISLASDVTSWNNLSWSATLPTGTILYMYVRTASTLTNLSDAAWAGPFMNGVGEDISSQTGAVLQFRAAIYSGYDTNSETLVTPTISSVNASCYVKGNAQTFYTSCASLGFVPTHILITYNGTIPDNTIIQLAVSTNDTTSQSKFKIINPNTIVGLEELDQNKALKLSISALGNTEVPFVIDEFAVSVSGDGFSKIL